MLNLAAFGTNVDTAVKVIPYSGLRQYRYNIYLHKLPEGVWLATSDQIPGLFVEGDSEWEARDEAVQWAKDLLVDNAGLDPADDIVLVFSNMSNIATAVR
jgi:predicted RNase H-like HicB family nuclease